MLYPTSKVGWKMQFCRVVITREAISRQYVLPLAIRALIQEPRRSAVPSKLCMRKQCFAICLHCIETCCFNQVRPQGFRDLNPEVGGYPAPSRRRDQP